MAVEGQGSDPVESAARRAAGIAEVALDDGARVLLCTVETSGPVSAEVADLLDVRRRLALAVAGTPSSPPETWPAVRITATAATRNVPPIPGDGTETEEDSPTGEPT